MTKGEDSDTAAAIQGASSQLAWQVVSAPFPLRFPGLNPTFWMQADLAVPPPSCACCTATRGNGDISFAGCCLPLLTHLRLPVNQNPHIFHLCC